MYSYDGSIRGNEVVDGSIPEPLSKPPPPPPVASGRTTAGITFGSGELGPKAVRLIDSQGDTWRRAGPDAWRLEQDSPILVITDESTLLKRYGPVTVIERASSRGPVREGNLA